MLACSRLINQRVSQDNRNETCPGILIRSSAIEKKKKTDQISARNSLRARTSNALPPPGPQTGPREEHLWPQERPSSKGWDDVTRVSPKLSGPAQLQTLRPQKPRHASPLHSQPREGPGGRARASEQPCARELSQQGLPSGSEMAGAGSRVSVGKSGFPEVAGGRSRETCTRDGDTEEPQDKRMGRERREGRKAARSQGWRTPPLILHLESRPLKLYLRTSLTVSLQGLNLFSLRHNKQGVHGCSLQTVPWLHQQRPLVEGGQLAGGGRSSPLATCSG